MTILQLNHNIPLAVGMNISMFPQHCSDVILTIRIPYITGCNTIHNVIQPYSNEINVLQREINFHEQYGFAS